MTGDVHTRIEAPAEVTAGWIRATQERHWLDDGTWVDVARGWLADADRVAVDLIDQVSWKQARLWRYDHWATEPRLSASLRPDGHPAILAAHKALRDTYHVTFEGPALALYRDGRDALGAHRDRELRYTEHTVIAVLTLGARRPWVLTPRRHGTGAPVDLAPGSGDLLVMGGRAQVDWLHGVPPAQSVQAARVSVQWRWTSGTGRPERGPGYRAPRHYSRGRPAST